MLEIKNQPHIFKKSYAQAACVFVLILLAAFLLWFNNNNSTQAMSAMMAQVYFDGEYRIGDGEWQEIVEGEHISSTKGDVTLRGNFHITTPDGEYIGIYRDGIPIAFYTNHINLTFYEGADEPYVIDSENRLYGASACGVSWTAHALPSECDDPIEIVVHNPHAFGNETAIDEMLAGITLWAGIDFEKSVLASGATQRSLGVLFMIVSLMLVGTALFSTLIHIKNSKIVWLLGLLVLFAGIYFAYSADGVAFWSESVVSNTTILGVSMMLYMMFLSMIIVHLLEKTKKIGIIASSLMAIANAVFIILPIVARVYFYDVWVYWIALQIITGAVFTVCLIKEFFISKAKIRWVYIGALLPLISFAVDVLGTYLGTWRGGEISQHIFIALFVVAMVMVLKLIPYNINAAAKAKELEMERIVLNAELADSRISTMMSQIRPHFIYNTLGSIEQLCKLDPPKAGELVHNFAKYLRGNFGELDNPKPISISQEMEHVHYYVSIENVRFPDMTFTFEMNAEDFSIPALTVQPIVENAIKHGLMKLPRGGTVSVACYETDTHYVVSVMDNGVGFDTGAEVDERKHVGLRNIRERLKVMVNGTLEIESTPGVGTKVFVKIPKETSK